MGEDHRALEPCRYLDQVETTYVVLLSGRVLVTQTCRRSQLFT